MPDLDFLSRLIEDTSGPGWRGGARRRGWGTAERDAERTFRFPTAALAVLGPGGVGRPHGPGAVIRQSAADHPSKGKNESGHFGWEVCKLLPLRRS